MGCGGIKQSDPDTEAIAIAHLMGYENGAAAERARHTALVAAAEDASLSDHKAIGCRCRVHAALRAALDGEPR